MSTTGEVHDSAKLADPNYPLTRKFAVGAAIIILTAAFLVHIHKIATLDQTNRVATETNGFVIQAMSNALLDKVMPVSTWATWPAHSADHTRLTNI